MTTFNTGNPIGSSDPRDLYDNAENADFLINGDQPAYNDRKGVSRKSWTGVEQQVAQQASEFAADQSARETTFANFLNSSGFDYLGEYAAGLTFTEYNQYVVSAGEAWFISPSTVLPYTTTGAGLPEGGSLMSRGEAVLRQEIGSGIRRVDSLAGLQAITGRFAGDVAYMVGRTSAGDGGEGEFRWDASDLSSSVTADVDSGIYVAPSSAPSGATGAWVRVPAALITARVFGGNSSIGDCFSNIQLMLDNVLPGGVVTTDGWTGLKVIDNLLTIEKPLYLYGRKDQVQFKLANQAGIFHATANGNGTSLINVTSSDATVSGISLDLNKLNNYVTVSGVNYYFLEESGANYRWLSAVTARAAAPQTPLENVIIENNEFYNVGPTGIGVSGGWDYTQGAAYGSAPKEEDWHLFTRNCVVRGNYISKGARSGIFFDGGVVNSLMENNIVEDWGWSNYRCYSLTADCVIQNNKTIFNKDVDATTLENSSGTYSEFAGNMIRLGHESRAPGTVARIEVTGNSSYTYGLSRQLVNGTLNRNLSSIFINSKIKDVLIEKNKIFSSGSLSTADEDDFRGGCIFSWSHQNIRVINNFIQCLETVAINFDVKAPSDLEYYTVEIDGNRLSFADDHTDPTRYGVGIYYRGVLENPDTSTRLYISKNNIDGFWKRSIEVTAKSILTYVVSENKITNAYTDGDSVNESIIYIVSATPCEVIGNTMRLSSPANMRGVNTSSASNAVMTHNTLIGGSYWASQPTLAFFTAGNSVESNNATFTFLT